MMNCKPTYISLFSSAGVGCHGFKMDGFECIATNELIERRLNVQKYNKKCKYDTGYICGDITTDDIKQKLLHEIECWKKSDEITDVDVIIATPPCQGMSVANHKKSSDEIIRNSLVVESIKIVKLIKPKFFIFENVSAFMKTACTDIDGQIKTIGEAIYNNLGRDYSIYSEVINLKNYGACSSRTRTLVISVRNDWADDISPIELIPDFVEERTLRETIGNMRRLTKFGEIDSEDIYHAFRTYPEHMRDWVSELKEGQSAFDNTDPLRVPHSIVDGKIIINQQKNGDKYRRQIWDKVGPCIHTRNDQFASQNTIHPSDDRVFSIRELMRMMAIPDDFHWVRESTDELKKLTSIQKRDFLKKEEMKIRQSLGEAVPTAIFHSIAKKINFFLAQQHLKTKEITQEIEKYGLQDNLQLLNYITQNPNNIGVSSLARIAEFVNTKKTENAAFFTNKTLVTDILRNMPYFEQQTVHILEPSVGVGNFLSILVKKYQYVKKLIIDVIDIDNDVLEILKVLVEKMGLPNNVIINYKNTDFLLFNNNKKYDIVIGNPPFNKLPPNSNLLPQYSKNAYNTETTNTFSFFLEKAINVGHYIAMITPKSLLNTPEFKLSRELLGKMNIKCIIDFGENGFKGVLVETIAIIVDSESISSHTMVISKTEEMQYRQRQAYIFDKAYPYWIIYRDKQFDVVAEKLKFDVFTVFRDRQITNKMLSSSHGIRVIKSRNISDDGTQLISIPQYDAYISQDEALKLGVYKFLLRNDVYLTPNMTYKPRVMKKPSGMLVNGSTAILILKDGELPLSEIEMKYFASDEFRIFYKTARNYQTRSLNVDSCSVFFFGRIRNGGKYNALA